MARTAPATPGSGSGTERIDPVGGPPHRVLIVSANMGEGHNATGRALEEAIGSRWPRCEIRWLDTLDLMGAWVGPTFRGCYVGSVRFMPWLYQFYFDATWRIRWFRRASKRFVGEWSGRRLAPEIARFEPDLIISTYPLGSTGLAWLRRHRGFDVPVQVWISDFAPHPFWVYDELDVHFVMHEVAIPQARAMAPHTEVRVSAPPVTSRFTEQAGSGESQQQERARVREERGLPKDAFVALVSCGSLGFGTVARAVRTLLESDPHVHVVAVAGRNESLHEQLQEVSASPDAQGRLKALGWVDDIPALLRASDIIVTNAGGATSLEALATGTPIVLFEPIAAHGQLNADCMARAGVAMLCQKPSELSTTIRRMVADPEVVAGLRQAAARHNAGRDLGNDVAVIRRPRRSTVRPGHSRSIANSFHS